MRYDWRTEAPVPAVITDIREYRKPAGRHLRRKERSDGVFWNMVFVGLCLSALLVLFFH